MPIEVKQLQIKSTVLQEKAGEEKRNNSCVDEEEMKADILEECRRLVIEILCEKKER